MNKKEFSVLILLFFVGVVVMVIVFAVFDNIEKERCLNMPFSDMMKDESCSMFWEALNE